jgi:hypothetical protein
MSKNDTAHHIAIYGGLAPQHACHAVHVDQVDRALRDCRDYFHQNKQTNLARLSLYAGAVKLLGIPLSDAHGAPSKWKKDHGGSAVGWTPDLKGQLRMHFAAPVQPAPRALPALPRGIPPAGQMMPPPPAAAAVQPVPAAVQPVPAAVQPVPAPAQYVTVAEFQQFKRSVDDWQRAALAAVKQVHTVIARKVGS